MFSLNPGLKETLSTIGLPFKDDKVLGSYFARMQCHNRCRQSYYLAV
jgi:hypothetical protein